MDVNDIMSLFFCCFFFIAAALGYRKNQSPEPVIMQCCLFKLESLHSSGNFFCRVAFISHKPGSNIKFSTTRLTHLIMAGDNKVDQYCSPQAHHHFILCFSDTSVSYCKVFRSRVMKNEII